MCHSTEILEGKLRARCSLRGPGQNTVSSEGNRVIRICLLSWSLHLVAPEWGEENYYSHLASPSVIRALATFCLIQWTIFGGCQSCRSSLRRCYEEVGTVRRRQWACQRRHIHQRQQQPEQGGWSETTRQRSMYLYTCAGAGAVVRIFRDAYLQTNSHVICAGGDQLLLVQRHEVQPGHPYLPPVERRTTCLWAELPVTWGSSSVCRHHPTMPGETWRR